MAKNANQINITGPKILPIISVPKCWIKNKKLSITSTMIIIISWLFPNISLKLGKIFKPSMDEVTVTAGVSIPSASRAEPPTMAGTISHLARRRTKV